jgi:hypothetical protein
LNSQFGPSQATPKNQILLVGKRENILLTLPLSVLNNLPAHFNIQWNQLIK